MSEFLKSVPSIYANNMGGDTVEAGKNDLIPPNEVKEEGTLQKCDTCVIKYSVPSTAALASSLTACPLIIFLLPA